jgi:tetratricopeptide (TPR) repeat protein
MKLKRSQLISQGSLSRMLQAADQAWNRRDFQQCIETLERASKLDHANSHILLQLGRIYGMRYEYDVAERCFEKAVRIASDKAETLAAIGKHCHDLRNYQVAERYYRRATEQKNASPEIFIKLAELCERLHRLEEANHLIDRALKINSTCAPALLVRARLDRQAGKFDEAEKNLRSFLSNADPTTRMHGWYELGALLDRQGRYDEAMNAFFEAKAIMRPNAGQQLAELQIIRARVREMKNNVSAEILQRWFDSGQELQPFHCMALLCGHPRSGTTLLEQVLDSHPDIVSAEETEIFYNEAYSPLLRRHPDAIAMYAALATATPDLLQQSRQNYFRTMELALGNSIAGRLLIDKNPSYTFLIPAFVRIFPETKILVSLRDPRDVVLSCFMQNLPLNQVGVAYLSLESTIEEYAALMEMWRTIAPRIRNPYLEIRYEDMVEDLESVARKTLDFLGVPWDARVLGFDEHARNKTVRSPTYADVTQPVYKRAVGRWRNYQKYLEPHVAKLEPFVKAFGYE